MSKENNADRLRRRLAAAGSGLSGVAIRRPVFTTMLMLGLVTLGIFGFRRLSIDQFPNVDIPVVTVQTVYPGASPETMEREVSRRLEEAFNTIQGVDRITSNSLQSVSLVIVEFDLDVDVDVASQDVRAKIEAVRRQLPADIESPVVQKFDPSALPIVSLAVSSERVPLVDLTTLADETIRRRLEAVRGVGEVRLAGQLEREVRVYLDPERMQALGVSTQDVMGALGRQNMEIPAGRIEQENGEQLISINGRIEQVRQFEQVIVATRQAQPVRLADVARVEDGTEEERSLALVDHSRAVAIDILKVSGANTVDVADGVNAVIADLKTTLPEGVTLQVVRDNSVRIRHSVEDVMKELLIGAFLTILVVMLFLNDWKATVITSFALPVSVVSTFILMNALGFSLNMITLLALALAIGILIDDAIVVIENIVRHREMGASHFEAAGAGTREIILAVMATTFSIVAVFVPVAFMGGIIGRFFYQFGVTVAWATLVSLFVSFTLTPMLSAWWGVNPHVHDGGARGNVVTRAIGRFNTGFDRLIDGYRALAAWALAHRLATLGAAGAAFIGGLMLFPFIGGEFMAASDDSEFMVTFQTSEGASLAYTQSKADQLIGLLGAMPEVDYTYTTIGAGLTGTVSGGEVYVKLNPPDTRAMSQAEMMAFVRTQAQTVYGLQIAVVEPSIGGAAQAPIQVEVRGPDVRELQRVTALVEREVRRAPGVTDVDNSIGEPRPEYRIRIDRDQAGALGLDIGMIAATVRPLLAGQKATSWQDPGGEERDVTVQIDPARRVSPDQLAELPIAVPGPGGRTVPLKQFAALEEGDAPAQIDRKGLQRVGYVTGSVLPGYSLTEASAAITERVSALELPEGYTVQLGGETEQFQETAGYVVEALVLAIILIFLILASQFESVVQPFAIMLSLPLSLIGVFIALLLTNDTMNMMSMIGVIMLMGLVTKNAILLIDNANEQQQVFGKDRITALIDAGATRFRPIMMTTLAMIFGMLPVALSLGEGGGMRAPMARAVIGGLITSTLLTLVVAPVAYTYFMDLGAWFGRLFGRGKEEETEEPSEELVNA